MQRLSRSLGDKWDARFDEISRVDCCSARVADAPSLSGRTGMCIWRAREMSILSVEFGRRFGCEGCRIFTFYVFYS